MQIGELDEILNLPKATLLNPANWTQRDSDILGHLLQVQSQIQQSRWNKSPIKFTIQGPVLLDHAFPEFEDFVFVAVYFRQLISARDSLLKDAVDRYCRFTGCRIRSQMVRNELESFNKILAMDTFMIPGFTARELFDAFLYGASLMHKVPADNDATRLRFLEICDNLPRHKVLYSLNTTLKDLKNHIGSISAVIYRDFGYWLHNHNLPRPHIRLHENLFAISSSGPIDPA